MIDSNDIVYISGPMTGLPDYNAPAFNAMEEKLRQYFDCKILNPTRHPMGLKYCEYMRAATEDILESTCVVMLNEWQDSKGAQFERKVAEMCRLRIYTQKEIEREIKKLEEKRK